MLFRTLCFIEFEGSCRKNLNLGSLKIVFLESTVHRLSVPALLVYQKKVHEDTKQVIPGASSKKCES
jgi:hypothetical protein